MDDMKQGIEVLPGGVSTALLLIVGILLSIFYTWFYRAGYINLTKRQEICSILDDLFPKKTTEMILYDQLLESKAQTIELKRFTMILPLRWQTPLKKCSIIPS